MAAEECCWLWGSGVSMAKDGTLRVISVKKLDSKSGKAFGENFYQILFEADAEYFKKVGKFDKGQVERRRGRHAFP
ncbi:MAG: hypothetical protein FJ242_00100 [Nitrospira sp.]|nr:hypothetical protein [Nitrospira sp.]